MESHSAPVAQPTERQPCKPEDRGSNPCGGSIEPSGLERFHAIVAEKVRAVTAQREEILTAFVAKYGFEPDECEQVWERDPWDGTERYYVRKRERR